MGTKIVKMPLFWDDLKKKTQQRIGKLKKDILKNRVVGYIVYELENDVEVVDWRPDERR